MAKERVNFNWNNKQWSINLKKVYVGDTAEKYLHLDKERLAEIKFFELSHDQLPDVIALSKDKNWLCLIEAVHSSRPIDQARLIHLEKLTNECTVDIIYVTAFLT